MVFANTIFAYDFKAGDLYYNIIPTTATKIGAYAFNECLALTAIPIPKSVISIGVDVLKLNYKNFYMDYIRSGF